MLFLEPNPTMDVGSFIAMGCVNPNTGGTDLLREPWCEGNGMNLANDMVFCKRCTTEYCNYVGSLTSSSSVQRAADLTPVDPNLDPVSANEYGGQRNWNQQYYPGIFFFTGGFQILTVYNQSELVNMFVYEPDFTDS